MSDTRVITEPPLLEKLPGSEDDSAPIDAMNWMMEEIHELRKQVADMYLVFEGIKTMLPSAGNSGLSLPGMPAMPVPKWARGR